MSSAGGRGGMGAANTGFFFIRLKPRSQRDATADQVVERLRPKLGDDVLFEVLIEDGKVRLAARANRARSGRE